MSCDQPGLALLDLGEAITSRDGCYVAARGKGDSVVPGSDDRVAIRVSWRSDQLRVRGILLTPPRMQSARAGACRLEIFHSGADAGAAQLPCRHQTRWASSDLLQHECRLRQRRVAPWRACLGAAPLSGAWRKCRQLLTPQSAIALLSASFIQSEKGFSAPRPAWK